MGLVRSEPTSWEELDAMEEFQAYKQKLLDHCWSDFLHSLQGNDDLVSLKFAMGFDGRMAHLIPLIIKVLEETISWVTRLPRTGARCNKNTKVSKEDFKLFLKDEYKMIHGTKGYPEV